MDAETVRTGVAEHEGVVASELQVAATATIRRTGPVVAPDIFGVVNAGTAVAVRYANKLKG